MHFWLLLLLLSLLLRFRCINVHGLLLSYRFARHRLHTAAFFRRRGRKKHGDNYNVVRRFCAHHPTNDDLFSSSWGKIAKQLLLVLAQRRSSSIFPEHSDENAFSLCAFSLSYLLGERERKKVRQWPMATRTQPTKTFRLRFCAIF